MTVDRVREVKAWSGVLESCCEDYMEAPSTYRKAVVMDAMRNLATAMDKALEEELGTPSETKDLPQVQ
jgi:hypothetical protein